MMRWVLLAVLVVAISALATVGIQYLPEGEADEPFGKSTRVAESDEPPGHAVITPAETTYEFGTLSQFTKEYHEWTIKNEGPGNLRLMKGKSSCSCTVANLPDGKDLTLKPGESTTVRLEWQTKSNNGQFQQSATILTPDDPKRQEIEFVIKGMVAPALVVVPPGNIVPFTEISNEESHTASVAVFSPDRPETKITELTTSKPDFFETKVQPLTKDELASLKVASGYKIDVITKPGLPLGDLHEELVIKTDHPKQDEMRLTITGKVVGPISVYPTRVRMTGISGSHGGSMPIVLWVRGQDQTKFEVESKPSNVSVEINPVEQTGAEKSKARRYNMVVSVPPGLVPQEIRGQILLKTDHPRASEVKIPVYIRVEAAG